MNATFYDYLTDFLKYVIIKELQMFNFAENFKI